MLKHKSLFSRRFLKLRVCHYHPKNKNIFGGPRFRHFRIFNFGLYFVKTQTFIFAQVSEPSASLAPKIFYFWRAPSHYHPKNIFIFGEPQFRHFRIFNFGLNFVKTQTFVFAPSLKKQRGHQICGGLFYFNLFFVTCQRKIII